MKLNLGCGDHPLPGYTNIDLHSAAADLRADFTRLDLHGITEVRMIHALEHIPWPDTDRLLARIRSWMLPAGLLVVETPDMDALLARGTGYPHWQQWIFGAQIHDGERHLAGFTLDTLAAAVRRAGFTVEASRAFTSAHPARPGYPCIEVTAVAA